jgi:hypothetical protein
VHKSLQVFHTSSQSLKSQYAVVAISALVQTQVNAAAVLVN